jgi:hypothetical protein
MWTALVFYRREKYRHFHYIPALGQYCTASAT